MPFLATGQFEIMKVFQNELKCYVLRFVKPRGLEKTASVQSRKGNFYMENNCVHGKFSLKLRESWKAENQKIVAEYQIVLIKPLKVLWVFRSNDVIHAVGGH